jgi:hypothetical protein
MRTIACLLGFFILYIAADYIGGILPWWVGLAIVLSFVAFLVSLLVKIGRSL